MNPSVQVPAMAVGLFLGMLVCLELGYRIGRTAEAPDGSAHEGRGAIEAAIFALLGLLLGFAFAGAMSRLDARRQLIVREANAIGTAYLRLDVEDQLAHGLLGRRVAYRLEQREAAPLAVHRVLAGGT